jgi:hypothetical protein
MTNLPAKAKNYLSVGAGALKKAAGVAAAFEEPLQDILQDAWAVADATRQRKGNLEPGDHLKVFGRGYTHHGIYAGDGQVIHLSRARGGVRKTSLEDFKSGAYRIWIVPSPVEFSNEEIVQRAERCVGTEGYHLLAGNCEHFCHWCRSGQARSPQVERWAKAIAALPGIRQADDAPAS